MTGPHVTGRFGPEMRGEYSHTPRTPLQGSTTGVDCRRATYCGCTRAPTGGSATVGSRKARESSLGRQDGHGTGAASRFAAAVQRGAGGVVLPGRRPPGHRPLLVGRGRLHARLQPPPRAGAGGRRPGLEGSPNLVTRML